MILESVVVVIATITGMSFGKSLVEYTKDYVPDSAWFVIVVQMAYSANNSIVILSVATIFSLASISPTVVLAAFVGPLVVNVVHTLRKRRQRRRALNGDYGEPTKWATELVNEGDREFALAVNSLPQDEITEVGIIAESKQELRERTVARFEERADGSIPEDFA